MQVEIPDELLNAAGVPKGRRSQAVAELLALELYRERAVSLGRAAELCGVSVAEFMEFAGRREVELDFDLEALEEDRRALENLNP
jgi:predicted HTH domain antitoxin